MKNTVCLALIILAALPGAAQKSSNPSCSEERNSAAALGRDYAARVDGLLREVHADLQKISERMEAGELSPQQGRELKLAATRDMIAYLDTISAVYDARLDWADTEPAAAATSSVGRATAHTAVSVGQLRREASAATAASGPSTPSAAEAAR
jgi:hypothetical protein